MQTRVVAAEPGSAWRHSAAASVSRWISLIGGLTSFGYVAVIAARNWRSGQIRWSDISLPIVALPCLAGLISMLVLAGTWCWLLRRLGMRVTRREALYAWFSSNLYKYVPGQIWMPIGRTALAARFGVPARTAVVTTAVEQGFSLLAAALLMAGALGDLKWVLLAALVSLMFVRPRTVNRAVNLLDRLLRRPPATSPLTGPQLLVLYAASWANLCISLAGFCAVFWALGAFQPDHLRTYALALTGSFLGGYLAVGAPAGLGVREGLMLAILAHGGVAGSVASSVAVIALLAIILGDVLCFAIAAAAFRWRRRAPEGRP